MIRLLMESREVHIAPMVDVSNQFFRFLMRKLTRRVVLWNEMLHCNAVVHGDRSLMLARPEEGPTVFQLGGNDPEKMASAAKLADEAGFSEVNINCGCPSNKAGKSQFGAVLMKDPELVARIASAMRDAVRCEVSVKCRLGVDDLDTYEYARDFLSAVHDGSGVTKFYIHARKVFLKGLDPKQNRTIPPLWYD